MHPSNALVSTMSSKIQPSTTATSDDDTAPPSKLPVKPIPGSYGVPFFSAIKDRLDYYYFQGHDAFFSSRVAKYSSTVFRVNMPPGPFIASDPRVVCVLDTKSFPVLFDLSKVEKRDVLTGTYVPSPSLTGGFRVCSYLDPSEPNHTKIKDLILSLLATRKSDFIPSFSCAYSKLFHAMEAQLNTAASTTFDFNKLNDEYAFEFVGTAFFGTPPSDSLGRSGPSKATKWLFLQLHPLMSLGVLPSIIEDLLLHTFRLPSFIVKSDYKALYSYFSSAAAKTLDDTELLRGLSRDEACHNLLFTAIFNAYGGMKVLFPGILARLARAGPGLHAKLASEVRAAVMAEGGKVTLAALERMELTKSVVYEALRMDPPVQFQYARAKKDLIIESHDVAFEVKKGEMIFGYQQFATRDGRVFENGEAFMADRFVGEKGKGLLKYVLWSNGPETETPATGNKQCAGKEVVVLIGRLLVVEFFLRYDTFAAEVGKNLLGTQVTITSLTKATAAGSDIGDGD